MQTLHWTEKYAVGLEPLLSKISGRGKQFRVGSAVPLKVELKELERTKFCRMYRMTKILKNDALWKTGSFPYKGLFW
jgi:hypothetical protein